MKNLLFIIFVIFIIVRIFFLFFEQANLYYPEKSIIDTPARLGINYEDVNFKTSAGKLLNGWFVPAAGAKVTIIYCHGNAGNISHRLHKVRFFHDMGVNFFIFDYRGYGKSKGFPQERGFYLDAQAAYDYAVSRKDVDKNKIVVYGKSLGGPVAADLCLRRNLAALVLEGSFASVILRGKELLPFLPVNLLVTHKFDALSKVKIIHIPKLIIHAKQDEITGFAHGQLLFSAAASPKQFLPFDGGHNEDIFVTSPQFRNKLQRFLIDNKIQ